MGLGDNALAALATRGLVEMKRLGVAMGADEATFAGLAGMGDLITTCISPHSRNRRVGELLASGTRLDDILSGMNGVPESVSTASLCLGLAEKYGLSMPISAQVGEILWKGKDLRQALDDLMNRTRKDED
jgi:glycerol-3-phosphate dehydrogenase (NAD(P)+)